MIDQQPFAAPDYVESLLWNHETVTYSTHPSGGLTIGEGEIRLQYRLDFDHGGNPARVAKGLMNIACFQRIADSIGNVWEARTSFSPHLFIYRLLDLNNTDAPQWEYNDSERLEAITKRPLLTGIRITEDDRFSRQIWIDQTLLEIPFDNLGLTIDIGYHDDHRVAVRVSGFFGNWRHIPMEVDGNVPVWGGGAIRPPHAGYDINGRGPIEFPSDCIPGSSFENLSPVCYSLWVSEFLFRYDAIWKSEVPMESAFPRPIIFRQVEGEKALPQEEVSFHPYSRSDVS